MTISITTLVINPTFNKIEHDTVDKLITPLDPPSNSCTKRSYIIFIYTMMISASTLG